MGELVAKWVDAVEMLSTIAEHYPKTAYAHFNFCLQNKWQYVQRVVADTAPFFLPLKAAVCTCFLLALLGIPSTEVDREYHQLLTHSIKLGVLAIHNPVDTAPSVHGASLEATCHLMESLVDAQFRFDPGTHRICATDAGQAAQKDQLHNKQIFLIHCGRGKLSVARWDKWNCDACTWLSVFPIS